MLIEDIGVIEVDRMVGSSAEFGRAIRNELCDNGRLNQRWTEVAHRVHMHSPATENPNELLSVLCILAAATLLSEGRIRAKASD